MIGFVDDVWRQLQEEIFGLVGGLLFFLSWVLQAWESRRRHTPVVTGRFFVLRSIACGFLIVEAWRNVSASLFIIAAGTLALNMYNISLLRRSPSGSTTPS